MMKLLPVLAVTSTTATLAIHKRASVTAALSQLILVGTKSEVIIAVDQELVDQVEEIVKTERVRILICEPTRPHSLARVLAPSFGAFDAVMIHDASRPMTPQSLFSGIISTLGNEVDAVRPALPFTETLKIVGRDSVIVETIDRSSVLRIGTPELIRVSAIDIEERDCGWFIPLKKGARIQHIEGSPDGARINTAADRDLMELQQN